MTQAATKFSIFSVPSPLNQLAISAAQLQDVIDRHGDDPRDFDDIPECNGVFRRQAVALEALAQTSAATVADLRTKAALVLRLRDWDAGAIEPDVALAISICRDLVALNRA